jgi:hypothetical protein
VPRPYLVGGRSVSSILLGIFFVAWGAMILFHLSIPAAVVGVAALILGILILVGS